MIKHGLLTTAQFISSPNFNDRPPLTIIDLIVIHGISLPAGNFDSDAVIRLFTNRLQVTDIFYADLHNLRVSSHLLIRRDGHVIQFVPFFARAWHAGESVFAGRSDCNDFSIGIELEGTDDLAYTDMQYTQLRLIIALLKQAYPAITDQRIVGHADIAPGRKTDPGSAFCWEEIK